MPSASCASFDVANLSIAVLTCCADTALVVGGQHYVGWLSRTLWLYNATEDSWARVGHAPLYSRGHVCGLQDGHLFMALGLQGQGEW